MSVPDNLLSYPGSTIFRYDLPVEGVLRLWLDTGLEGNTITHENHREFSAIWPVLSSDDRARVILVRGVNGTFCSGGDMSFLPPLVNDPVRRAEVLEDIVALVRNVLHCSKPVITALEGVCSGGGLAMALMADIPVAAKSTVIIDSHVMAGLACGDHAALVWPMAMGMARAKYHLLSATPLSGEEAARSGLVAASVADDELHDHTLLLATRIAGLHPEGVALTKKALGGWYQLAMPIFEASAGYEAGSFAGEGARQAITGWQDPDRKG